MARGRLKRIHVNQHHIRENKKTGSRKPVVTVKEYDSNLYGHEVDILDGFGNVLATVVYRPDNPLSCGARVWIETRQDVVIR